MKNILFPTEFSNHAPEVFKYAAEMAYFFKARLVVLHVINKPELQLTDDEALEHMADVSTDNMLTFVQKNLPKAYQKDVEVSYIAKTGLPATAILRTALEEDIDLIVMGMTGKTNTLETIFGKTTPEVLAKADCPVLIVPSTTKFAGIDNMVYTTNFEFRDLGAINYLKNWSKTFDAQIHCLHIIENNENEMSLLKNMSILKENYKGQKRILFDMSQGDFQEKIESFAKSKKADLIAMMSHKRNFISRLIENSSVKGVARRTNIPLLVIKDNAFEVDNDVAEWLRIANSIA